MRNHGCDQTPSAYVTMDPDAARNLLRDLRSLADDSLLYPIALLPGPRKKLSVVAQRAEEGGYGELSEQALQLQSDLQEDLRDPSFEEGRSIASLLVAPSEREYRKLIRTQEYLRSSRAVRRLEEMAWQAHVTDRPSLEATLWLHAAQVQLLSSDGSDLTEAEEVKLSNVRDVFDPEGPDPGSRERAEALFDLGLARRNAGSFGRLEVPFRLAAAHFEDSKPSRGNLDRKTAIARAYHNLIVAYKKLHDDERALQVCETALNWLERVDRPRFEHRRRAAHIFRIMAIIAYRQEKFERSMKAAKRGIETVEKVPEEQRTPRIEVIAANLYHDLATAKVSPRRDWKTVSTEATGIFNEATKHLEKLPGKELTRDRQAFLAKSYKSLGMAKRDSAPPEEAIEVFELAVRHYEELSEEAELTANQRSNLARSYLGVGAAQSDLGNHDESEKTISSAVNHLEKIPEQKRTSKYRAQLATAYQHLSSAQLRQDKLKTARENARSSIETLKSIRPDDSGEDQGCGSPFWYSQYSAALAVIAECELRKSSAEQGNPSVRHLRRAYSYAKKSVTKAERGRIVYSGFEGRAHLRSERDHSYQLYRKICSKLDEREALRWTSGTKAHALAELVGASRAN